MSTTPGPIPGKTLVQHARAARTTIALKLSMAVSGAIFILFVLAHMYGNLKAFAGHDAFNTYSEHLREIGEPMLPHAGFLWIMRAILIVSLVVHVWSAVALWRRSGTARTVKYQVKKNPNSSLSSRTMRWGGLAILLFVVWHLIEFTFVKVSVNPDATGANITQDPYNLVVASFEVWWMTLIYLLAMLALGMHLHHGTFSAAQTLGLTTTVRRQRTWRRVGWVVAIVIAGGFSLVPIFVLAGVISR
ncbi:MAG TPA: succinate dehydrogenase cytochrome b subunit [Marmoricola sp.]|nr:succinate dehydrogenase cytochrome b subunit [Marmoricola sp.]